LIVEPELSDRFIEDTYKGDKFAELFDAEAWIIVDQIIKDKVIASTCPICNKPCQLKCIECTTCHKWFHYACQPGITQYAKSGKQKIWPCSLCKQMAQ